MASVKETVHLTVVCAAWLLTPFVAIYLFLPLFLIPLMPVARPILEPLLWYRFCDSFPGERVERISGYDFARGSTTCTTVGSFTMDEILVGAPGETPDTLIFRYAAGRGDLAIASAGPDRVLISVPYVEHIYEQRDRWRGLTFEYRIDRIGAPGSNDPVAAKRGLNEKGTSPIRR